MLPVSNETLQEFVSQYPTPFYLYDEKGIRERVRCLLKAFAWAPDFKEYFAVKATPNPAILRILREEGCGVDCSSMTELMLSDAAGLFELGLIQALLQPFGMSLRQPLGLAALQALFKPGFVALGMPLLACLLH